MSNNQTVVSVTADASGYTSELTRAERSLQNFTAAQDRASAQVVAAQAAIAEAATNGSTASTRSINSFMKSLTQLADTVGKSRSELLEQRAALLGVSDSAAASIAKIKAYEDSVAAAGHASHQFSLESAGSRRELLVLGHELSQGNIKGFAGSLLVLAERSNAMGLIFNKTALSIGAFTAVLGISAELTVKAAEALAEYGESIEKIAKTTGLSTNSIQTFGFAAGVVGVSTKDAATALTELGKAQNEAIHGNKDAAAAFKALGISQTDLKNTSPDQLLGRIASAFAGAQDGAAKAAVANELFGSSGAELIPLLDRGSAGLTDLYRAAEDAGAVLGGSTLAQLAAFKEQLNESAEKMAAANRSAQTQLIPTILNLTAALGDNAALKPLLVDFYSGVAVIIKTAASAVATLVIGFEQTSEVIATIATVIGAAVTGQFKLALASAQVGYDNLKRQGTGYSAFMKQLWSDTAPPATHPASVPQGTISFAKGQNSSKPADENALNAQMEALKGQLDAREKLMRDSVEHIKSLQQQGVIDAQTAIQQEHDARAAAYADELALVDKEVDLAQHKKQQKALEEWRNKKQSIQDLIAANDRQTTDALSELQSKELRNEQAYTVALNKELQTRSDAIQAQLAGRSLGTYASDELTRLTAVAKEGTDKYADLVKSFTENKISSSQFDAQVSALQKYQAQRVALEQNATDQMKAADQDWASGAERSLNNYVDAASNKYQQMGTLISDITKGMEDAIVSFATTGKLNFSSLVQSIIAGIIRIQTQALLAQAATKASGWLSALFSVGSAATSALTGTGSTLDGLTGSAASSAYSQSGGAGNAYGFTTKATGGLIVGPGTGTSDSIIARVSNGEGILTAAAMKRLGSSALDALNNGATITGLAKFASGGTVGTSSAMSAVLPASSKSGDVNISIEGGQAGAAGGGFSAAELSQLKNMVQGWVDQRIARKSSGQGGLSYQLRNGLAT